MPEKRESDLGWACKMPLPTQLYPIKDAMAAAKSTLSEATFDDLKDDFF